MKTEISQQAYIHIDRVITVHCDGETRNFPLEYDCQRNVILSEMMRDPERLTIAEIIKASRKSAYRGCDFDISAKDNFRTNVLKSANDYLKKRWSRLGKWETDEQKRMFLTKATSNTRITWQLYKEGKYKEIPAYFGELPVLDSKAFPTIEKEYIKAHTKGLIAVTKPLVKEKIYSEKVAGWLDKFTSVYPDIKETTELYMRLLLNNKEYELCEEVYQNHKDYLTNREMEPSSIVKEVYNFCKLLKKQWLLVSLSSLMPT